MSSKSRLSIFLFFCVFGCLPAASMEYEIASPEPMAKKYSSIEEIENYSINLMWIGKGNKECLTYIMGGRKGASSEADSDICSKSGKQGMEALLKQANKWHRSNPKATINFWYSAAVTNDDAVENTRNLMRELGVHENVNLKKIEDIEFIQKNRFIFQSNVDVYIRVDYAKLLILLHEIEIENRDSAVFTDFSISENGPAMTKDELYKPDVLASLQEYGLVLGSDLEDRKVTRLQRALRIALNTTVASKKVENQFIQVLSSPELIISLKHTINFSLNIITKELHQIPNMIDKVNNWQPITLKGCKLSEVLDYQRKCSELNRYKDKKCDKEHCFGGTLYSAVRSFFFIYLSAIKSGRPVKIRADVVGEGGKGDWVNYDPIKHRYIMFGNVIGPTDDGIFSYSADGMERSWREITKLPIHVEMCNSTPFIVRKIARTDLSIGHTGNSHIALFEKLPELDGDQDKFMGTYWELTKQETEMLNKINSQDDSQSNEFQAHKASFVSGKTYQEYITAVPYLLWNWSASVASDLSTTFADAILGDDR